MKRKMLLGIAGCVVLACWSVGAEVLFEDTFDSDDNWVEPVGDILTRVVENGRLVVENTSDTYSGHLRHSGDSFTDFTVSLELEPRSETFHTIGLLLCMGTGNSGYMFTVASNDIYSFFVWDGDAQNYTRLASNMTSHINQGSNTVKVSKNGSVFHLYCNDRFLETITDDTYGSGEIGVSVGSGEKVAFDNMTVTDDFVEPGSQAPYIEDDFADGNLDGWAIWTAAGDVAYDQGALSIGTGDVASNTIVYTTGDYNNVPVRVIAERDTLSSADDIYGIVFLSISGGASGSISSQLVHFAILGDQKYSITNHSVSGRISTIHGDRDTIEVTENYQLVVNGNSLESFDATDYTFSAVGLYVDAAVSVSFDDFSAGVEPTTKVVPYVGFSPLQERRYVIGGSGLVIDPSGRQVATFVAGRYREELRSLGFGPYFVITRDGKRHTARQAIINSR